MTLSPELARIVEVGKTDPKAAYRLVEESITPTDRLEWSKFRQRQGCIRQAMSRPLPGAAGDAFLKGSITVADCVIFEVMPIHLKCLQLVNSPLLDLVTAAVTDGGGAKREFECVDEAQLCYIFTENPETLYDTPKAALLDLIKKESRARFMAANSALVNGICSAIIKQFERHIATTVKYASEVEGQTEKKSPSPA